MCETFEEGGVHACMEFVSSCVCVCNPWLHLYGCMSVLTCVCCLILKAGYFFLDLQIIEAYFTNWQKDSGV